LFSTIIKEGTPLPSEQLENVEYFKYLGSMITNETRCTREIKSRMSMAKAAFNKKIIFNREVDLHLWMKLGPLEKDIRNSWKVSKYDAREGWTRSVGPIV
jgi:hypothetical protein